MNKEEIKECIFNFIFCAIFIGLIVLLVVGFVKNAEYCEENPNDQSCKPYETTNNSDSGIKCGWVFGVGYRCGMGF